MLSNGYKWSGWFCASAAGLSAKDAIVVKQVLVPAALL